MATYIIRFRWKGGRVGGNQRRSVPLTFHMEQENTPFLMKSFCKLLIPLPSSGNCERSFSQPPPATLRRHSTYFSMYLQIFWTPACEFGRLFLSLAAWSSRRQCILSILLCTCNCNNKFIKHYFKNKPISGTPKSQPPEPVKLLYTNTDFRCLRNCGGDKLRSSNHSSWECNSSWWAQHRESFWTEL